MLKLRQYNCGPAYLLQLILHLFSDTFDIQKHSVVVHFGLESQLYQVDCFLFLNHHIDLSKPFRPNELSLWEHS